MNGRTLGRLIAALLFTVMCGFSFLHGIKQRKWTGIGMFSALFLGILNAFLTAFGKVPWGERLEQTFTPTETGRLIYQTLLDNRTGAVNAIATVEEYNPGLFPCSE